MNSHGSALKRIISSIVVLQAAVLACAILTPDTPTEVPDTPTESIDTDEPPQTAEVEDTETPVVPTEVLPEPTTPPSGVYSLPIDLQRLSSDNVMNMEPWGMLEMSEGSVPQAELAFSPDGDSLAVHTFSGDLALWDVLTGAQAFSGITRSEVSRRESFATLAISPRYNAPMVSSGVLFDDGLGAVRSAVMLWDLDESDQPTILEGTSPYSDQSYDPKGIRSTVFSNDGELIAAGTSEAGTSGGLVRIWETDTGSLLHEITFPSYVSAVAFSPESNELVAAVFHDLVFIDPDSGVELRRFYFPSNIHGLSYSADGRYLVLEYEAVTVIDPLDGSVVFETIATTTLVKGALSPDGSILATTERWHMRIFDVESGVELASFREESILLLDVAFADHGHILATFNEAGQVHLWGVSVSQALPDNPPVISISNAATLTESAHFWRLSMGEVAFSDTSEWVAFSSGDEFYILEMPTLDPIAILTIEGYVFASADGQIRVWSAEDTHLKIYDLTLDEIIIEITGLSGECCHDVHLSPDGNTLAFVDGTTARIYDLDSMEEIYSHQYVQQIHVSPDGDLLGLSGNLEVVLWDISTQLEVRTISGFVTAAPVFNVDFSPDWRYLRWASRGRMQFMNVETGDLGADFPLSWGVFSPDSSLFAGAEMGWYGDTYAGQVILIDVHSDEQIGVLQHDPDRMIGTIAFSPDGNLIAVGIGNSLTIWDVNRQQQIASWTGLNLDIRQLSFSPDGRILAISSYEEVNFWNVPGDDT